MGTSRELFPPLYSLHGKTLPNSDSFNPIANRKRSIPPFTLPNIVQENPSLTSGDLHGFSCLQETPGAHPRSTAHLYNPTAPHGPGPVFIPSIGHQDPELLPLKMLLLPKMLLQHRSWALLHGCVSRANKRSSISLLLEH